MAKEIFAVMREANKLFPLNTSQEQSKSGMGASGHALTSDLTKLCLPEEFRDSYRKLAWANSICLLFLLVGVVGLKAPPVRPQTPNLVSESVPVILVPIEQPAPKIPETSGKLQPLENASVEQPVVATVVAADANTVAFAVPVAGPLSVVPARFAAAEMATNPIAPSPKSTPYVPTEADWGGHKLEYPPLALRHGYQGKVALDILVAPSGEVLSAKVRESSGHKILDDAALDHVRRHLRLRNPPGETRLLIVPFDFQLKP